MGKKIYLESFKIVGISVKTTNQNEQSAKDIIELWQKFYSENISSIIPNKVDENVYSVYTDYESDYTSGYTTILGHKVSSFENMPTQLVALEINGGDYLEFKTKGKRVTAVIEAWQEIWLNDSELKRKYTADFEVYGEKSLDPFNSEVDIYVAVR